MGKTILASLNMAAICDAACCVATRAVMLGPPKQGSVTLLRGLRAILIGQIETRDEQSAEICVGSWKQLNS